MYVYIGVALATRVAIGFFVTICKFFSVQSPSLFTIRLPSHHIFSSTQASINATFDKDDRDTLVWPGVTDSCRNSIFSDDGKYFFLVGRCHFLQSGCILINFFHQLRHQSTTHAI